MKKYVFGIDIGGTTVKIGFFTSDGVLKDDWEIKTDTTDNGSNILKDIYDSVMAKLEELSIDKDEVEGIGIGLPGPVKKDGTVLRAVNLGWGVFNIEEEFSKLSGLKVKAGNDANVAALGEMYKGGGRGCLDMVMITLGTGIGGGIIIDGKIHPGVNGAAGEIGHIAIEDPEKESKSCGCGKKGCIEQYGSANGIVLTANRFLEEYDKETALKGYDKLNSKIIFDEARNGDQAALEIVEKFYDMIGWQAATIATVVDPERFVVGGGMSKAGQMLIDGIKEHYKKYAFHGTIGAEFSLAELGNKAGMYGAAKLIIG